MIQWRDERSTVVGWEYSTSSVLFADTLHVLDNGTCQVATFNILSHRWIIFPFGPESLTLYDPTLLHYPEHGWFVLSRSDYMQLYSLAIDDSTEICTVVRIELSDPPMPGRSHFAAAAHNGKIWMHGGVNKDGVFNDTYSIDLKSATWNVEGQGPSQLCSHAMHSVGGNLYILGGFSRGSTLHAVADSGVLELQSG